MFENIYLFKKNLFFYRVSDKLTILVLGEEERIV